MDSASLTTTLVTPSLTYGKFLKDNIEVAQQIQTSVGKIPQKRENLRKLSTAIVKDLLELEKFYDKNGQILSGSADLQAALDDVASNLRMVSGRCRELFPAKAVGRVNTAVAAFKAWTKRKKVEAELLDLKERIHACYIRFTAFAAARTEQTVSRIENSASRIERTLLVLDNSQRSGLNRMFTNLNDVNRDIGGSSPLSASEVSNQYLHLQIDTISNSLGHLASSKTFVKEEPRGSYLQPFKSVITRRGNQDISSRHRDVVADALQVLKTLQDDSSELSIQDGAWDMVNLAIQLHGLELYTDAATIGNWTVDLYRTLVATNKAVFSPYLALGLRNLYRYRQDTANPEGATLAIEECVDIYRNIRGTSDSDLRLDFVAALMELRGDFSSRKNFEKSLEVTQEGVKVLGEIYADIAKWEKFNGKNTNTPQIGYELPDVLDLPLTSLKDIRNTTRYDEEEILRLEYNTARVLHCLSYSLEDVGRASEAYEIEKLALARYTAICARNPGSFDDCLAGSLLHLSQPSLSTDRPVSETLAYAEQAVKVYHDVCQTRPVMYSKHLYDAMYYKSSLLAKNEDLEGALEVSKEAITLTRQSPDDRQRLADALRQSSWILGRMKRYDEAVDFRKETVSIYRALADPVSAEEISATTVPDALCDLAIELRLAGRFGEAETYNMEAVNHYRALAMRDATHMSDLAKGLSCLTQSLGRSLKYDQALEEGHKALELYRVLIHDDPKLIQPFLLAIQRTSFPIFHSDSPDAVPWSAEIVQDFRNLIIDFPEEVGWKLVDALNTNDYVLTKHKRHHETLLNGEAFVELFKTIPLDNAEAVKRYVNGLCDYAGSVNNFGHPKKAIAIIQDAIAARRKLNEDTNDLASAMGGALASLAECLRDQGCYEEALAAIEEGVELLRRHRPEDDTIFACRLRELSLNLAIAGRLDEAVKIGQEAVDLCRESTSSGVFVAARLPYTLEALARCVADAGDEEKALSMVQEAVDLYRKIRFEQSSMCPWVFAEPIYAAALHNLSNRLAASGRVEDALASLVEAQGIYESLSSVLPGHYTHLAKLLCSLSSLLCAAGRHDEGIATEKALADIQSRFAVVDPEVALLVDVALKEQNNQPSQQALQRKYPKCDHLLVNVD